MQIVEKERKPENIKMRVNDWFKVSFDSYNHIILSWRITETTESEVKERDFHVVLSYEETATLINFLKSVKAI